MKNLMFVMLALFVIGIATSAYAAPAAVTGTISYANGSVVNGANVNVMCSNVTGSATSDAEGHYNVIFDSQDCKYNDPVNVTATLGDASGMTSSKMCGASECFIPVGLVDVTIPEFGVIGTALVLLAGIGLIAYRRK